MKLRFLPYKPPQEINENWDSGKGPRNRFRGTKTLCLKELGGITSLRWIFTSALLFLAARVQIDPDQTDSGKSYQNKDSNLVPRHSYFPSYLHFCSGYLNDGIRINGREVRGCAELQNRWRTNRLCHSQPVLGKNMVLHRAHLRQTRVHLIVDCLLEEPG